MPRTTVDIDGKQVDFDAAVALMDGELREQLHHELAPCGEQAFMDRYLTEHEKRFGEPFAVS